MESNNPRLVLRPGGAQAYGGGGEPDEMQVAMLVSMGFSEAESIKALLTTGGAGGIQPAIDNVLQERELLAGTVLPPGEAPVPSSSPAKAAPFPSPAPVAASPRGLGSTVSGASSASKIASSFNTQARDDHARREQEELARKVKVEQAKKKDAQSKIKMQMSEDKILRRLTQTVRRADSLSTEELERARQEIADFIAASRPCDELTTIRDQLGNVIASRTEGLSSEPPAPATAQAAQSGAAQAPAGGGAGGGGGDAVACTVRVRLEDGTQVTNGFQSTDTVAVLHDWVARRHGDANFALIVPGPPSVRREFGPGPETMGESLRAAGMVPMGALTLQPTAKKDMISKAPDGAEYAPARGRGGMGMRGGMMRGGMGGMDGGMGGMMRGGMRGGYDDEGGEEDEDDEDDEEMEYDEEGAAHAFAQAQTASMEAATEARFAPTPPFAPQASLIEALGIPPEEVPEDFLDPITQQYMLQPVKLPSSGAILDRSTVLRHLQTNQTDPYTQTPLTAQMLKPDSELAARMEAWLAGKRAAARQ